jgi:hypothetical protein
MVIEMNVNDLIIIVVGGFIEFVIVIVYIEWKDIQKSIEEIIHGDV